MKTTKTFWISLTAATACCAVLLVFQSAGTRSLAGRLESEKALVAELEREERNLEEAADGSPFLRPLPTEDDLRNAAVAEARAATTPGERVKQTREKLERLVDGLGDLSNGPGEFFRVLPDILRVVQDLSVEEMIQVAEGMGSGKKNDSDPKQVTRMILLVLAAEQDPERVMRNAETMKERELREMVLGALARRDPDAARRWVANSDMSEREKAEFTGVLASRTLREDVDAGLRLLREAKEGGGGGGGFGPFSSFTVSKEKIPELVAAMRKPENEDLREMLETMVVTSAMLDGGFKGAREQVEAMGLGPTELSAFLSRNSGMLMEAQPEEMLDWHQEVQTPEEQANTLPNVIGNWARSDFNAAGEWLGKMEASPVKDAAIQRFVQTVVDVDPQSAVVWAGSIEGEGVRAASLVHASEQWLAKDRPAAEKWMAENGVDLETLRKASAAPSTVPMPVGEE